MDLSFIGYFLLKGLQISSPIAWAALGGVFSERAGVVNIALEGIMTVTSLMLVWGSITFQSIWISLIAAILSGMVMALIHAVATVTFRVDHVVSGVAINVFAIGLTRFVCQAFFGQETQSAINARSFPLLGGINSLAFGLIPAVALSWFLLQRTVFGLRLRSVGEHPEAADTLGVNVVLMRYLGVVISGALCGIAAATLYPDKWISGMVAGRGYMALAAVIFGRWNPLGVVLASLLFGYADTIRIVFESQIPIPSSIVQMFPYVLALAVLAGLAGKARAPAADGRNFEKGLG
jgi:simple sugar transport system permease protein